MREPNQCLSRHRCRRERVAGTYYCARHQQPYCLMGGCYEEPDEGAQWCPRHLEETPLAGTVLCAPAPPEEPPTVEDPYHTPEALAAKLRAIGERPHTTHHDDCGCLRVRLGDEIARLTAALREVVEVAHEATQADARALEWARRQAPEVLRRAAAALGEEEG